ncbi:MAG: TIR domain-containing protein [Bacteroidetes bacterium]|jgi:hypothetical protein|nr:TIR domain-containing protein [Bacteroidota bacterium]
MKRLSTPTSVFLVHAREDKDLARRLKRNLERVPFVDVVSHDDVSPEDTNSYRSHLANKIRNSSGVAFLLTPKSQDSDWSLFELGMAIGANEPFRYVQTGDIALHPPFEQDETGDDITVDTLSQPTEIFSFLTSFHEDPLRE